MSDVEGTFGADGGFVGRGEQGALFDSGDASDSPNLGYRGATACAAAGITYRQLDYWARTGLLVPSIRSATGSGSQRLYSFRDILVLRVIKRLLDTGVSLQNVRKAVEHLRERGIEDLSEITLMSDGASIFECVTEDEVIDIMRGGQGVFGIAIGRVRSEVAGTLARFPQESIDGAVTVPDGVTDELAARRSRRTG
ncbi:MAG: MerR family transcriptional regulator [Actinobacteria bacterium]|nr:MerR family transcriptional regulator [Actinomycetota bacterium]MCB9412355.1 MerR family transcriptional regulator [Actinomycetota bacterium]